MSTIPYESKACKKIIKYFSENTQEGCDEIGYIFTGLFYYDTRFWSIDIPHIYGEWRLSAGSFLDKKMPESIKNTLFTNKEESSMYGAVLQHCVDYAFGFDSFSKYMHVSGKNSQDFAVRLYRANENFMLAIYALLSKKVNSVTLQTMGLLGMAVELFLKSLILKKDGNARKTHDLNVLGVASGIKNLSPGWSDIYGDFVNDRYSEKPCSKKDLWLGYQTALEIACSVLKELETLTKNQAP